MKSQINPLTALILFGLTTAAFFTAMKVNEMVNKAKTAPPAPAAAK